MRLDRLGRPCIARPDSYTDINHVGCVNCGLPIRQHQRATGGYLWTHHINIVSCNDEIVDANRELERAIDPEVAPYPSDPPVTTVEMVQRVIANLEAIEHDLSTSS